jgi:hypothetical protein
VGLQRLAAVLESGGERHHDRTDLGAAFARSHADSFSAAM